MKAIKEFLKSKKVFYLLFFVWIIFWLWLAYSPVHEAALSCDSSPGPFLNANRLDYRITTFLNGSLGSLIISLFAWIIIPLILIIQSLLQRSFKFFALVLITFSGVWIITWSFYGGHRAFDARRMAELKGPIRNSAEVYYADNGRYPGISGSNQYKALEISKSISDKCSGTNPEWEYQYWVSPDGQEYILKAYLFRHHNFLNNDLDGNVLGASCGANGLQEREYCISPHSYPPTRF